MKSPFGYISKLLMYIFMVVILVPVTVHAQNVSTEFGHDSDLKKYIGRYGNAGSNIVYVDTLQGKLFFRPIFWRSKQYLNHYALDTFFVADNINRKAVFLRDTTKIIKLKLVGIGIDEELKLLGENEVLPVELLFKQQGAKSAEKIALSKILKINDAIKIGTTLFEKFPSKILEALEYFTTLQKYYPSESKIYSSLGNIYIMKSDRKKAAYYFNKSFLLNNNDEAALLGLQKLGVLKSDKEGWILPFSINKLFEKPTENEIKKIEKGWDSYNLSPQNLNTIVKDSIDLFGKWFDLQIISHSILGSVHYGALLIPRKSINSKFPIIMESKGVSWNYKPLDLEKDLLAPKVLKDVVDNFIFIIPSFRGEELHFKGKIYKSEGDPTNSFSGASTDAIAFLYASLAILKQADSTRICAFGTSRGGSVSLLTAIREASIRWVVAWAAPADWFELMGEQGWTEKEIVSFALENESKPFETGGQFIERFLQNALKGSENIDDVRQKMIESSPIYFVNRLPNNIQLHYGIDDEIVPIINGKKLEERIRSKQKNINDSFKVFFHQNAGHDLDQQIAFSESKKFFNTMFINNKLK